MWTTTGQVLRDYVRVHERHEHDRQLPLHVRALQLPGRKGLYEGDEGDVHERTGDRGWYWREADHGGSKEGLE